MPRWFESKIRNENILFGFIPIILIFLSLVFFHPTFSTNDDVEVRSLLNGTRYGIPDNHIIYINSILTYLISKLYTVWPTLYWYEMYLSLTSFTCCCILLYFLKSSFLKLEKSLYFPMLFLISVLMFKSINSMSYTSSAILLTGTSVILFYHFDSCEFSNSGRRLLYLVGVYFTLILGYLTRPVLSLVVLAFLVPSLFLLIARKRLRRTKLLFLFVASTTIGICKYISLIAYKEPGWRNWKNLMESFIWPGDFNLLRDSVNNSKHSFLLSHLGVSDSQIQLWYSANNIDPDLFSERFINAAQNIPLIYDSTLILGHLGDFFQSYWHYLLFSTVLVCHRWYLSVLNRKILDRSSSGQKTFLALTFQYIYGVLFFIALITYRKDVQRVSIGLILVFLLILIVIGYKQEKLELIEQIPKNFSSKLFSTLIYSVCLVLMLSTIQAHPAVRNIFGGEFHTHDSEKSELIATEYISSLPQCSQFNTGVPKCVLFLHTNSSSPFMRTHESNVNKLYLFWSAFSPKWEQSILDSGRKDSLDLLCSNRGFLLNSKDGVAIVKNYIRDARSVLIDSIPVSTMAGSKGQIGNEVFLTIGASAGGC